MGVWAHTLHVLGIPTNTSDSRQSKYSCHGNQDFSYIRIDTVSTHSIVHSKNYHDFKQIARPTSVAFAMSSRPDGLTKQEEVVSVLSSGFSSALRAFVLKRKKKTQEVLHQPLLLLSHSSLKVSKTVEGRDLFENSGLL